MTEGERRLGYPAPITMFPNRRGRVAFTRKHSEPRVVLKYSPAGEGGVISHNINLFPSQHDTSCALASLSLV